MGAAAGSGEPAAARVRGSPRAVLDACVLYPTVLRRILLAAAGQGLFVPLWSARILEEWARAAARSGTEAEALARAEIALVRAAWPRAELPPAPAQEARLWLPDPADRHVLAVAVAGSADLLVTFNARDFPRGLLAAEGLRRLDPDQLLCGFLPQAAPVLRRIARTELAGVERASGEHWSLRRLLRRAGLPRLGKALEPG